jgi:hypothetical protein
VLAPQMVGGAAALKKRRARQAASICLREQGVSQKKYGVSLFATASFCDGQFVIISASLESAGHSPVGVHFQHCINRAGACCVIGAVKSNGNEF